MTASTPNQVPPSDPENEQSQPDANETQLTDQTNLLPVRKLVICFLGLSLCNFVAVFDSVVIATALSTISSHFNAGSISSWIPSAYMLTSTGAQPLYGRFSDIFGRKTVLLSGILLFMIGNLAAGFSRTIVELIVFRGIAGLGGGCIKILYQIVISDVVSLRERGKYQGIAGTVIALGYGIGPIIGGVLVQRADWRWCFWISVPIAFCSAIVITFFLPLKPVGGNTKKKLMLIDYAGSGISIIASTLIMLPLIWGGVTFPWKSPIILGTLIGGVCAWVVFVIWEWKGAKLPIVPMHMFRHSTVCGVFITTFITGFVVNSAMFYLPQFFQTGLGYSPIRAGVILIPVFVPQMIANQLAGMLMSKTGRYRGVINIGNILSAIACGLISTITPATPQGVKILYMIVFGIGTGLTLQTSTVAAQASVERKDMSVVTAFRNFVRFLGSTLALAVGAALINNGIRSSMQSHSFPEGIIQEIVNNPVLLSSTNTINLSEEQKKSIVLDGYLEKGFEMVFFVNAALLAAASLLGIVMIKHKDLTREDDGQFKERLPQVGQEKA